MQLRGLFKTRVSWLGIMAPTPLLPRTSPTTEFLLLRPQLGEIWTISACSLVTVPYQKIKFLWAACEICYLSPSSLEKEKKSLEKLNTCLTQSVGYLKFSSIRVIVLILLKILGKYISVTKVRNNHREIIKLKKTLRSQLTINLYRYMLITVLKIQK